MGSSKCWRAPDVLGVVVLSASAALNVPLVPGVPKVPKIPKVSLFSECLGETALNSRGFDCYVGFTRFRGPNVVGEYSGDRD